MNQVLQLQGLRIGYGGAALLPPISLELAPGQMLAVLGRSGSGKSTLLRTLLGQQAALAGTMKVASNIRQTYVPQRHAFEGSVPFSAREVVATGLDYGWSFLRPQSSHALVDQAIESADVIALAERHFGSLSEGEKQRVLLARVLASQAGLVLMDEPTAAMDLVSERASVQRIRELCDSHGIAVILVTHFVDLALEAADKVLLLDRHLQQCIFDVPGSVAASEAFAHSFGKSHSDEPCA